MSKLIPSADRESDLQESEYSEVATETIWHNPTDRPYVLDLHVGAVPSPGKKPSSRKQRYGIERFVIPPGAKRAISRDFDKAIQDVRDGIIVGGLGPHLINEGAQERPILSPALDASRAAHEEATKTAAKAQAEALAAERRALEAEQKLAELERRLTEPDTKNQRDAAASNERKKA